MLTRIFWVLVVAFMQTSEPDTIHLTVIDSTREEGAQGVGGVVISFSDNSNQLTGQCVTVAPTGMCDIVLNAPEGFIRGSLIVGGFGSRSVIWPGGVVNVVIDVGLGSLHPNHPPHTTFDDATFTPTPTTQATFVATSTPTSTTAVANETFVSSTAVPSSTVNYPLSTFNSTPTPTPPSLPFIAPTSQFWLTFCSAIAFFVFSGLVGLGAGWYLNPRRNQ